MNQDYISAVLFVCSGSFYIGIGPLDAQNTLLEDMLHMVYDNVDISNAISVIESVAQLIYQHIVCQEKVLCRSNTEGGVSARSCFGGVFTNMLRSSDSKVENGDASQDSLMSNLLKLVNILVQISLPGRGSNHASSGPGGSNGPGLSSRRGGNNTSLEIDTETANGAVADMIVDSSLSDARKISQGLTGTGPVLTSTPRSTVPPQAPPPQSDDEKSATDEQKTESVASAAISSAQSALGAAAATSDVVARSRACSHFPGAAEEQRAADPTLADIILAHPGIMHHLLLALSCCNSTRVATMLSSFGIPKVMQDSFSGIDPVSVGDGVFQVSCLLGRILVVSSKQKPEFRNIDTRVSVADILH